MSNRMSGKAVIRIDCNDNLWKTIPSDFLEIHLLSFTISEDYGPPRVTPKPRGVWKKDVQGNQYIEVKLGTNRRTDWDRYQMWRNGHEEWLHEEFNMLMFVRGEPSFLDGLKIREGERVWMEVRYEIAGYECYDHYSGGTEFDSDFDMRRVRVINRGKPYKEPYVSKDEQARRHARAQATLAEWLR